MTDARAQFCFVIPHRGALDILGMLQAFFLLRDTFTISSPGIEEENQSATDGTWVLRHVVDTHTSVIGEMIAFFALDNAR